VKNYSTARSPLPGWSERKPPTILVVEDEPLIGLALVDALEERGFVVMEAGNAAAAIQCLVYSDFAIDAVITDICMPGEIDGLGLLHWIRENRPSLPIIITSGVRRDDGIAEATGGACFFDKPYDCAVVADRIHQMIEATPTWQDCTN